MPRPVKFTRRIARLSVLMARGGEPLAWIAEAVGVGDRTLRRWVSRGRAGEAPFAAWAAELDEAIESARRRRAAASYARESQRSRARWREFRESQRAWGRRARRE